MRIIFSIILSAFCTLCLQGQELHTKNKKAIAYYTNAKAFFETGNYYEPERLLKQALERDESFDEAILMLHHVYLKRQDLTSSEQILITYLEELSEEFINRIYFDRAYYLTATGNYIDSKALLQKIDNEIYQVDESYLNDLNRRNDFALTLIESPLDLDFEELPLPINTFDLQYFPSVTFNNTMVYTVRGQNGRGDEDLYYSKLENEKWSVPKSISFNINTDRNEGTASISGDGKTLVFTACNREENIGSCDLYISYFKNENWTEPLLMSDKINSEEWDSQPCLSADGNFLYFVSKREGGFGEQDIWYSRRVDGEWIEAMNLGPTINGPNDEASPYLLFDNQTLVYASKSFQGMGGFDLFKSVKSGESWEEPENLGYPLNDFGDQVGYSISKDRWTYFSSSDEKGRIVLKRFKLPEELIPESSFRTKSKLFLVDANSKEVIEGQVQVASEQINISVAGIEISFVNQELKVTSDGYWNKTYQFTNQNLIREDVYIPLISMSDSTIADLVFEFEFDSSDLKESAQNEIKELVQILKDHPKLNIQLEGFSDPIGSEDYNMRLSENRVETVRQLFQESGIESSRIKGEAFGEIYYEHMEHLYRNINSMRIVRVITSLIKK